MSRRKLKLGSPYLEPLPRDREAEKRVLRRHKGACALAQPGQATLGDILDRLVYADGIDDHEPFERRALGMVATWLDAIDDASKAGGGLPSGLLYSLHCQAEALVEIGARLEEAGPVDPCEPDGTEEIIGEDDEDEIAEGTVPS